MNNLKTFYRLDQVSGISTEDILRYAIDGHLTLSVNLTKKLAYQPCELYQEIDPLIHPDAWLIANKETLRVRNTLGIINPADSEPLDLIINSGNVREQLELLFNQLPDQKLSSIEFALLEAVFKHGHEIIIPITVSKRSKADSWERAFLIPEDGYLVITKANLNAFKAPQLKSILSIPKVIESEGAKDLEVKIHALAIEYIQRHKTRDLHPSQNDVCLELEKQTRERSIYGVHNKPMTASYIKRNFIQGKWWKENNYKK